ncbi:HD domain-containing protein [Candidatus Woesearchaeota archaeon]|nr:HD domain-containing protein [Candidatus Woesearchaeota archaeon]
MIDEIRKHVKEQCMKETNFFGMNAYSYHFRTTVKYAKLLADKLGADKEIVEIAAWLHDIGSITGNYDDHHIAGAEYAEELLKGYDYPQEKIEKVKHCIIAHRGSKSIPRETIEAECIASADAMSHFDNVPGLFHLAYSIRKKNVEEAKEFVIGKLQRSWNKLTPEAKEVIKPKYESMKVLLE